MSDLPVINDSEYIKEMREFYNNVLDKVKNGEIEINIAQKIFCTVSDGLLNWKENKEFFWNYLINTDGTLGGYFPSGLLIPQNQSFIISVREVQYSEDNPDYTTKYFRESDTYHFNGFVWINDSTGEELASNKTVVTFSFLPNCEVRV